MSALPEIILSGVNVLNRDEMLFLNGTFSTSSIVTHSKIGLFQFTVSCDDMIIEKSYFKDALPIHRTEIQKTYIETRLVCQQWESVSCVTSK